MKPEYRVLVAVPTMGSVHPLLVKTLLRWAHDYPSISYYFSYLTAPVDRARNQIVKMFLGNKQLTHLLFIDSDTIPEPDALVRLLSHNKPIVSGLTPIVSYKNDDWEVYDNCFVARSYKEDGSVDTTHIAGRHTGLQEIFRCGSSCILIRRDVFEALDVPYYDFITNDDNTQHVRSEDINFCDKAKAAGFHIYADTDVICKHCKSDIMVA